MHLYDGSNIDVFLVSWILCADRQGWEAQFLFICEIWLKKFILAVCIVDWMDYKDLIKNIL